MRVLVIHVGNPVDPDDYKGQQLCLEPTLTQGMQHFRYTEVLNNVQTRESLETMDVQVDYIYFTGRRNPINCVKAAWRVRQLGKQYQYDVVNQYWGGFGSFLTACFCRSVFVISFMGSDLYGRYTHRGSKTMNGRLLSYFSQLTGIFATGIIVMSAKMKNRLWKISRNKAVAICEGFSPGKFYEMDIAKARKHLGWDEKTPVVLFFPSEAYVKNTPLAMAAFDKLKETIPEARLVLVINVPHAELVWHYNAADLLLITSYHEGSNNSLKEAMACNLPVVSTDVGDARERLNQVQPSVVVDGFNAQKIADAMLPILQQRKRSNGSSVVQELQLPDIATRIIAFYKNLLKKNDR